MDEQARSGGSDSVETNHEPKHERLREPLNVWIAPLGEGGAVCFKGRKNSKLAWGIYYKPLDCFLLVGTTPTVERLVMRVEKMLGVYVKRGYSEDDLKVICTRLISVQNYRKRIRRRAHTYEEAFELMVKTYNFGYADHAPPTNRRG